METDMTREEAIRRIKSWNLDSDDMEVLSVVIPELSESEDERIRRTLVEYFGPEVQLDFVRGVPIQKIRDWLEKQKEQKPVERSLEDDHIIGFVYDLLNEIEWKDSWAMSKDECLRLLNNYSPQRPAEWSEQDIQYYNAVMDMITNARYLPCRPRDEIVEWLKSLKNRGNFPKNNTNSLSWSEEDEHRRTDAIYFLESAKSHYADTSEIENTILWLKSLRPSWKPSEEQIDALRVYLYHPQYIKNSEDTRIKLVESLYNDLKKL